MGIDTEAYKPEEASSASSVSVCLVAADGTRTSAVAHYKHELKALSEILAADYRLTDATGTITYDRANYIQVTVGACPVDNPAACDGLRFYSDTNVILEGLPKCLPGDSITFYNDKDETVGTATITAIGLINFGGEDIYNYDITDTVVKTDETPVCFRKGYVGPTVADIAQSQRMVIEGCILSDTDDPESDKVSAYTVLDGNGVALFEPLPLTDLGFVECC